MSRAGMERDMTTQQQIAVMVGEQPVEVIVSDAVLNFTLPILSTGWPFGENPKRGGVLLPGVPTVVDRVAMPGKYRVVKWLLLISDDVHGLGISSEINAFMKGGTIEFTEFAVIGDADLVRYEVDLVVDDNEVRLMVTSGHDGVLEARSMKIGLFS
ncbi:MAG: hypothetical protein G8237_14860 [Magnetococcales bacterium]|nr:hypothetical protein [Magnetococcales bacterium]